MIVDQKYLQKGNTDYVNIKFYRLCRIGILVEGVNIMI